ncbi:hypothetical protein ACFYYH_03545 [Streptomyces sp. NPDC002018]|uniref:hypothetical protein n=1 Tax=Streptomyces sp. NPDC002018 TaxID=3364629 RepID=UPI0036977140
MALFDRKRSDQEVAEEIEEIEEIERGKREGRYLLRVRAAHQKLDQDRPVPEKSTGQGASGPSCKSASTPKKRGWFS